MNKNLVFKAICITLLFIILSVPLFTFAQQNAVQVEAMAAAEADAKADTDPSFWFIVGCFGNLMGLLYANFNSPTAPASRLLGKSPEYVAFYSDTYAIKAKKIQMDQAVKGCVTNAVASVACGCLYIIGVSSLVGSSSYY